jgi:hypothetical protein
MGKIIYLFCFCGTGSCQTAQTGLVLMLFLPRILKCVPPTQRRWLVWRKEVSPGVHSSSGIALAWTSMDKTLGSSPQTGKKNSLHKNYTWWPEIPSTLYEHLYQGLSQPSWRKFITLKRHTWTLCYLRGHLLELKWWQAYQFWHANNGTNRWFYLQCALCSKLSSTPCFITWCQVHPKWTKLDKQK